MVFVEPGNCRGLPEEGSMKYRKLATLAIALSAAMGAFAMTADTAEAKGKGGGGKHWGGGKHFGGGMHFGGHGHWGHRRYRHGFGYTYAAYPFYGYAAECFYTPRGRVICE
jgi:hypothetical protein